MTRDVGPWTRRKMRAASERGRRMALRRWEMDRARRDRLAAADPAWAGREIVRRIVVIDHERTVREVTIYADDSLREARRKLRRVLAGEVPALPDPIAR